MYHCISGPLSPESPRGVHRPRQAPLRLAFFSAAGPWGHPSLPSSQAWSRPIRVAQFLFPSRQALRSPSSYFHTSVLPLKASSQTLFVARL